jgi:hypothetical protein
MFVFQTSQQIEEKRASERMPLVDLHDLWTMVPRKNDEVAKTALSLLNNAAAGFVKREPSFNSSEIASTLKNWMKQQAALKFDVRFAQEMGRE